MHNLDLYNRLREYGEEHIISFFDELSEEEKNDLRSDIEKIDFSFMKEIYENSYVDEKLDLSKVSPLKCIVDLDDDKRREYSSLGKTIVENGEYAVLIMAGGNGSRLGFKGPKGALELDLGNKKISLFELFIQKLRAAKKEYGVNIHLYLMTSSRNNDDVVSYFEKNDYFSYSKELIHFFIQDNIPILDVKGHILLESKSKILFGPNGNGNVFESLKKSGLLNHMKDNNIKYVLFTSVDDVLVNLVDTTFLGAMVKEGYKLCSKTLFKEDGMSKDWVFCKYDGAPFILPREYITEELTNAKDENGRFLYREKNILYHIIDIDSIEKFANLKLPYNRAYKKSPYIDLNGNFIEPESPNSFKFEQFIFDAFRYESDMLLYRIKDENFCPIKTKEDIDKAIFALKNISDN